MRSRAGPVLKGSGEVTPPIRSLRSLVTGAFRGIVLDRGTSSSFFDGVFEGNFIGDMFFFLPFEAPDDTGFWVSGFGSEYFTFSISSSDGSTSPSDSRFES